jgi:predicted GNAT family acetyltransferase
MKCKLLTEGILENYGYFDGDLKIAHATLRKKKDGYSLQNVFINEEYRGRGLCTKFLQCVLKKKSEPIFLSVLIKNIPAIKCYTNLGFKEIDKGKSTLYMRKN